MFHVCCRRQGLQRQREDRFVPPGGVIMGDDQMMRQHQGDGGMPIRNEGMDMGQGMRPDDMNRRDGVSITTLKRSIL